jgi:hypothetical protein
VDDGKSCGSWGEKHGNMTRGGGGDGYLGVFEYVESWSLRDTFRDVLEEEKVAVAFVGILCADHIIQDHCNCAKQPPGIGVPSGRGAASSI